MVHVDASKPSVGGALQGMKGAGRLKGGRGAERAEKHGSEVTPRSIQHLTWMLIVDLDEICQNRTLNVVHTQSVFSAEGKQKDTAQPVLMIPSLNPEDQCVSSLLSAHRHLLLPQTTDMTTDKPITKGVPENFCWDKQQEL